MMNTLSEYFQFCIILSSKYIAVCTQSTPQSRSLAMLDNSLKAYLKLSDSVCRMALPSSFDYSMEVHIHTYLVMVLKYIYYLLNYCLEVIL